MRLILLNKPFQVLPQFTGSEGRRCLGDLLAVRGVYPAGRLDYDSEGLMVLTDFGPWQARISQPGAPFPKRYLVQVRASRARTRCGACAEASAGRRSDPAGRRSLIAEPEWLCRAIRRSVSQVHPDTWLEITLSEGRNRQVRRMTASVGLPTLRLVREAIGPGPWRD